MVELLNDKESIRMVQNKIIELYRKIICSLACIERKINNNDLKIKSTQYLNNFISIYEIYINTKVNRLDNIEEIIEFCNDCYNDKDIFEYAEDLEYGYKVGLINKERR